MNKLLTLAAVVCLTAGSVATADESPQVAVGKAAPDFTATGIDNKPFKLSEKLSSGDKNIVLLFSRAHW